MRRFRSSITVSLLGALLVAAAPTTADDLGDLVKRYERIKKRVVARTSGARGRRQPPPPQVPPGQGQPNQKPPTPLEQIPPPVIDDELKRLLAEIGEIDSEASLTFLLGELVKAPPPVAAGIPRALLASSSDRVLAPLVKDYAKLDPKVRDAILFELGESEKDLSGIARSLVALARNESDSAVKRRLPAALGRLDSVASASVLVQRAVAVANARAGRNSNELLYNAAAEYVIGKMESEEVKAWLGEGAFKVASKNTAQLAMVLRLVGTHRVEAARDRAERAVSHKDPEVAAAAVAALSELGVGDSFDKIARAVSKGGGKGSNLRFLAKALDALASAGTDRAFKTLLKFARGKDARLRAVAMGSLALFDGDRGVIALAEALADPDPSVRSTCLLALDGKRHPSMIPALIDFVEREPEVRLRFEGLRMLVVLTGQNFELRFADWRKWWKGIEPEFTFSEKELTGDEITVIKRATAEDVDLTAKFFGMEVTTSKKIAFLVDVSGSMQERSGNAPKIEVLKSELMGVIEKLTKDTRLNIVTFSDGFRPWKKKLTPLKGSGRGKAISFVKGLKANGATNIFDTLEFALNDAGVDTIFLLSDGAPSAGKIVATEAIIKEVKVLNRARGVTVNCISFGAESPFLQRLAKQNRGSYRFVSKL